MLRVGDTIQCHDMQDMIDTSNALMEEGYFTDWLDIKATDHTKWRLTVVSVEKSKK